ncbi:ankyrin repeat domain-containing protein [Cupriavidus basilensis]|nr:ankyrin repeat domain-containing protein [Cupriavidus basilensis]
MVGFWVARKIWIRGLPESRRQEVFDQEKRDKAIENGASQLMLASAEGDMQRVRELLSFGVDANQRDHRGGTALMFAAKNGHEEVVSHLLAAGASSHLETDRGNTAADFAIKGGFAQLANRLQAAAASQNQG